MAGKSDARPEKTATAVDAEDRNLRILEGVDDFIGRLLVDRTHEDKIVSPRRSIVNSVNAGSWDTSQHLDVVARHCDNVKHRAD